MPSPEEKAKRQAIKEASRQPEHEQYRASLPISAGSIRALFDFIDAGLVDQECDNTLKHALTFLKDQQIEAQPVVAWLESNGGFCDCEVLANVEEKFLEAFPDETLT